MSYIHVVHFIDVIVKLLRVVASPFNVLCYFMTDLLKENKPRFVLTCFSVYQTKGGFRTAAPGAPPPNPRVPPRKN